MTTSIFPQWAQDFSTVCSVCGLLITIFLWVEARDIKNSFMRRARLPQIKRELSSSTKEMSKHLADWDNEKFKFFEQLLICKGKLENLLPKLPKNEKKLVVIFIGLLKRKKWFIFELKITGLSKDEAWNIYTELSGVISTLDQLAKDSKWN